MRQTDIHPAGTIRVAEFLHLGNLPVYCVKEMKLQINQTIVLNICKLKLLFACKLLNSASEFLEKNPVSHRLYLAMHSLAKLTLK